MKVKNRKKGTFSRLLIRNYIAFTLGIIISFFTVVIISMIIIYGNVITWSNYDPEDYTEILQSGLYNELPIEELFGRGSSVLILNNNLNVLYKSNENENTNYSLDEIEVIPEYNKYTEINVEKYEDYKGNERIFVSKSINGLEKVQYEDYWIFNDNLELMDSTTEMNRKKFTIQEYNYLTMKEINKQVVMKYLYKNNDGQICTMIIKTNALQYTTFDNVVGPLKYVLSILIILYLVIILLFIKWLNYKVKKPLKLLNEAILNVSNGNKKLEIPYSGPVEFVEICDNFENLASKLWISEINNKKLQEEKKKILADISHDLKTPITVIQGYSKAICDGIIKANNQEEYLMKIYKKTEDLTDLINKFSEYNRLEHPDFKLNVKMQDLCEFFREYLVDMYSEIELYGFSTYINIPDESFSCNFDSFQLKRALDNIVSNALKHNPKGTTLFFSIHKENENIKITIADNGRGISKEVRKNIFEAFTVGDESRNNNGSGLGLAISKKIILNHNGTIRLVYPPREGYVTEFQIVLPYDKGV